MPSDAVVDRLGAGLHRLDGVGDHRQRLVLDLDRPRGPLGQLFRLRRHGGHRLAHAPHLVGQHVVVLVQRPRHGDDALVVEDVRDIVEGEHDRAHRFGRARVDALDAGVRVRAGDEAPVQHPRQDDVAEYMLLPRHPGDAVLAPGGLPTTLNSS